MDDGLDFSLVICLSNGGDREVRLERRRELVVRALDLSAEGPGIEI